MPNKLSDTNDDRYKSLGFESTFDGSAGGIQWSELVEDLKTNVLRQNLRVRKLIMGEYNTTVAGKDMAGFGGQRSMGTTSIRLPTDWTDTPTVGGADRHRNSKQQASRNNIRRV